MKGMTLYAMAKACDGTLYGDKKNQKEVTGVVIDSRKVQEGNLFIATKGERVDGHQFIPDVFEKGCMGAVCETLPKPLCGSCILVKDSIRALQDIAEFYRKQLDIQVVGVTGSVGKTSTKEFIAEVLSEKYRVLKTQGNFNNEIGLSLTVLSIRSDHQVAVLEMGISHFGEMHGLSKIARPDVCVMTNIGECHLEFLGDRDGILRAKSEIFDFMNPDGAVCLNGDDDKLVTLQEVKGIRPVFYGRNEHNDITATRIHNHGLFGSDAVIHIREKGKETESLKVEILLPGTHMVDNALAAAAVGLKLGLSLEEIVSGIQKAAPVSGRSNIIRGEKYTLIDDCYNANPVSMKAAIDLLLTAEGRKAAILGDMFELGENERALHEQVGAYAVEKGVQLLICTGILSKSMYDKALAAGRKNHSHCEIYWFQTKQEMLTKLPEILKPQDTILIKASHGMGFDEVVKILQK